MSFNKRLKTPKNANGEYLTQSGDFLNTFNKTNYSSFRDKMKMMNNYKSNNYYRPNPFNSFFKSSAPFNYYNNMNERNRLLVRYNGGPQREYNYITRDNISKFLRKRNNSNRYKRPCGCYSKYNISKYSQVFDHPEYENEYQNGFYNQGNKLPLIGDNDNNMRYSNSNGFMTPEMKNKRFGKLTYKLKDNFDNENYQQNNELNNLAKNQNANENIHENENENVNNINENINQIENNEVINDVKKEDNNENIDKKVSNGNTIFILRDNCNIKPRRRFHKVQIFNNYKPFLVDDFKEYGYFE